MDKYFVGLDLGQSHDFAALAVVQRAESKGETVLRLRHEERVPLGTSYPEIVERVAEVMSAEPLRGRSDLIVDGTGVVRPVIVTGGLRETQDGDYYGVPKRDLMLGCRWRCNLGR